MIIRKKMSKLVDLINSLRAYTVVIIENDFLLLDDSVKLLANYCFANESVTQKINNDLKENKLINFVELLYGFKEKFLKLDNDYELIKKMDAVDYFDTYLEKIGEKDILNEFNFEEFEQTLKEDELSVIKKIFLKYGFCGNYIGDNYNSIIEEIKKANNSEILLFNNVPSDIEENNFINSIKSSIKETGGDFYLCLIDRNLGNGSENEGREFINQRLYDINENENLKSICFVYTSKPDSGLKAPNELKDYYIQEIEKTSPPNFEGITKILAQSAYATVFDNICNNFYDSADSTLETVLKNQKNIKYIVDKSHEEGISPYDSIKYWYNLLLQKYFEKNEIANYSYVATLSSFFKNDFLDDHQNMSAIDEDINDLNNYELFDDNVNKKLLPIAPGDIWYSNGDYYILMGQLCDMLIRKGNEESKINTRNGKIGEFLKISFEKIDLKKDKYYVEVINNKKSVYIQNFIDIEGEYQRLKIDISTPNIDFTELRILDLCMFNLDGECKLNVNKELDTDIKNMLNDNKDIYFENLQKKYKNIGFNNLSQIIAVLDDDNPIKFGMTSFIFNNNIVDYGLKRVSRLKGRYYDSLYNNFINNKGRIDLNLIDNYAIKSKKIKLRCKIGNFENSVEEIEIDFYSNKDQKYFLKKDFLKALTHNYNDLINILNDQINPSDKNHFLFIDDEGSYELLFLIKLEGKAIDHSLLQLNYQLLFKSNKSKYKNLNYFVIGMPENLISFDGNLISLEDLKTGIEIPNTNEQIILSNGIITINSKE